MTRAREAGPVKDPKTGVWGFVVDVGVDEHGKRKQARRRGFRTKKLAQGELDKLRSDVANQTYVPPARQTFSEFLDEWLAIMAGPDKLKPSTLSSYTRVLRIHVRPRIGGLQLQALTAGALDKLYLELGKTLSPRSTRYVHAILHGALKWAVKQGRVVRNVADAATPPEAKHARAREMTVWSAADIRHFFEVDEVKKSRERIAWWVAVMTGVRRGELLGLRWGDVDLDGGQMSIVQTITAVDHKIVIGDTKTGKSRSIGLDAATIAELRAHRARQAQEHLALGIRPGDATLVFSRPDGAPLDPDRFSERLIHLVERHPELPRIRLHDLRHTHATILMRAGVPITVVRAGWATAQSPSRATPTSTSTRRCRPTPPNGRRR